MLPAPPVPAHIAAIERPVERLMTYYCFKAVLSTVALPIVLPMLYFRYHTMRYRFDAEGIKMSWGVIFRHEIMLNYSRIQDIHLQSSLLERMLGLARIEIQTAAGSSSAEMTLEGLTDHEAMRDFLYSRMRGARERNRGSAHPAPSGDDEVVRVLREIAGELRAIRTLTEQRDRA
jgi:putative membrane protein